MRRPLLVLVCVAGLHSAAAAAGSVEVKVDGVVLDPDSGSPVVRLVEKAKAHRELPIWIGPFEAQAIALEMQGLTPEMAVFFEAPEGRGVLVSDVAAAAPARDVARGDVIVALDDEPVGSVDELTTRAGAHTAAEPVRLSVRRAGRPLQVRFQAAD